MFRVIVAVLLCCTLSSFARGDEMDLGTLKLDLSPLKSWGTKKYSYTAQSPGSREQIGLGTMTYETTVKKDTVILHDSMDLTWRGQKLKLTITHTCNRNSFLSPNRIESSGEGDDELKTFVAITKNGKAAVKLGDRQTEMDLPDDTVTTAAMMRIVTLVPRKQGTQIRFKNWLESSELNLKKDFTLESLGAEAIERGDGKVSCTKFQLTGGGNHPAFYWVDSDGILQRALIDHRKVLDLQLAPEYALDGKVRSVALWFKAADENDLSTLKSVFSKRMVEQFDRQGWDKVMKRYHELFRREYGEYDLANFGFEFSELGVTKGEVIVTFKSKRLGGLRVIQEGGRWKVDEN